MIKAIARTFLYLSIYLTIAMIFCSKSNASCKPKTELNLLIRVSNSNNIYISENGTLYEKVSCNNHHVFDFNTTPNNRRRWRIHQQHQMGGFSDNSFDNDIRIGGRISELNEPKDPNEATETTEPKDPKISQRFKIPTRLDLETPGDDSKPFETIEISPVYGTQFMEVNRELTINELLNLKRFLLERIDSELSNKYRHLDYIVIENNNSILRAKIEHMHREITRSNWETLQLTITPTLAAPTRIDIVVSAILYIGSGLEISPPPRSAYSISNDNDALEEYIKTLITYLKNKIPYANFTLSPNNLRIKISVRYN